MSLNYRLQLLLYLPNLSVFFQLSKVCDPIFKFVVMSNRLSSIAICSFERSFNNYLFMDFLVSPGVLLGSIPAQWRGSTEKAERPDQHQRPRNGADDPAAPAAAKWTGWTRAERGAGQERLQEELLSASRLQAERCRLHRFHWERRGYSDIARR